MTYEMIDGKLYAVKREEVNVDEVKAEVTAKVNAMKRKKDAIETAKATIKSYEAQIAGYEKDIKDILSAIDVDVVKAVYPDSDILEGFTQYFA
ncbi:MAG: hypothetical protein OSJ67_07585 [Clostridia bacterium]|nr:hypothetical protein [Clostridia bacterium]